MHAFVRLLLVLACVAMHLVKVSEAALSPMSGSRLPALSSASLQLRSTVQGLKRTIRESVEDTWADLPLYRSRFPSALRASISAGMSSFTSSLGVLFPVAVVLSIRPAYPNWPAIFKTGFFTGLQWSAFSGVFVGGETMAERLRGRKDRLNSCVGSGLSGALAQYHVRTPPSHPLFSPLMLTFGPCLVYSKAPGACRRASCRASPSTTSSTRYVPLLPQRLRSLLCALTPSLCVQFMGGKDPFLAMTTVTPASHSQAPQSSKATRPRSSGPGASKAGSKPSLFSSRTSSGPVKKAALPPAKKPAVPVKKPATSFWQRPAAPPARKPPTPRKPPAKKPPAVPPRSAASHAHPLRKPVTPKKPLVSQLWPSLPFTSSKPADGPAAKRAAASADQQQRDRERQRKRRAEDDERRRKKREQDKAAAEALRKKKQQYQQQQQQQRSRRV